MLTDLLNQDSWQFYAITFFCLILGIFLAYLGEMKKLNGLARAERKPTLHWLSYYNEFPYASWYSALSSVLGYMLLIGLNELSIMTAVGMGFVGESVSDSAGRRTKDVLGIQD